jgi:hypothetical protein
MEKFESPNLPLEAGDQKRRETKESRNRRARFFISGVIALVAAAARRKSGITSLDGVFGSKEEGQKSDNEPTGDDVPDPKKSASAILERAGRIYRSTEPVENALNGDWEQLAGESNEAKRTGLGEIAPDVMGALKGADRAIGSMAPQLRRLNAWLESKAGEGRIKDKR